MTTAFYAPPGSFRGNYVVLPDEEARHATRVLRMQVGDELVVVDGVGGWHRLRLDHVSKREVAGTVLETRRDVGEEPYDFAIGIALLKNRNRFETALEKAAELGVRRIIPLLTDRTHKESFREERAHKILIAAMKQCGRSRLVQLEEPQPLDGVVEAPDGGLNLVCSVDAPDENTLVAAVQAAPEADNIRVLIGPEGGFAPEELRRLTEVGYHPVSLGRRRLRGETAVIAAAAGIMLARDGAGDSV